MPAERVIDNSLFMLVIGEDDITLCFSVYRVLQLCSALTKACVFCNFA